MRGMKRLFLLLPLLLVTGCSYGSKLEADEACDEWRAEGKELTWKLQEKKYTYTWERWDGPSQADIANADSEYQRSLFEEFARQAKAAGYKRRVEIGSYNKTSNDSSPSRFCRHEEETRQFLGRTKKIVNQKKFYNKNKNERPEFESSITKRFKY